MTENGILVRGLLSADRQQACLKSKIS